MLYLNSQLAFRFSREIQSSDTQKQFVILLPAGTASARFAMDADSSSGLSRQNGGHVRHIPETGLEMTFRPPRESGK